MLKELLVGNSACVVPKGWKTTKQWADGENVQNCQASVYLRKGLSLGLIEMKKFRVLTGSSVRPVPHYRLTLRA